MLKITSAKITLEAAVKVIPSLDAVNERRATRTFS